MTTVLMYCAKSYDATNLQRQFSILTQILTHDKNVWERENTIYKE